MARYWSEMRRVGIKTALLALLLLALGASGASAQDGIFIDPDSPSGKEYEIPLETVRRGAERGTDPSAPITQGERSAAPFGEGISGNAGRTDSTGEGSGSDGSATGSDRGQNDGGGDGATGRERDGGAADSPSTQAIVEAAANNPGAPPSSAGSTMLYVGVGALVLALGAGAGVLMRRRRT